jgi:hypothetical protein
MTSEKYMQNLAVSTIYRDAQKIIAPTLGNNPDPAGRNALPLSPQLPAAPATALPSAAAAVGEADDDDLAALRELEASMAM